MTEFKVPELGENVAGGDVMRILVNVGDTIARDQPVLELETDKATIEVPSSVAGTVKEVLVKNGDKVKVGAVILRVEDGASDNGAPEKGAGAPPADADAAGATEPPAQASAQTPDSRETPPASAAGADSVTGPGANAGPSKVLPMPPRSAAEASAAAAAAPAPGTKPARIEVVRGEEGPVKPASPAVRKLAREIGVDVGDVQGSGPGGRISRDDIKEHARRILSSVGSAVSTGGARAARPLPDFQKFGPVDRQPWSNIRRATAEHLSYAWNAIPHVTQFDKADITSLDDLRRKYKDQVATVGGNLTVTAMLVRVLASAIQQFPQFNASIDTERGEIVLKKYVNIGVAVDTDRGLLVPVIRNADQKNVTEISVELQQAAEKARARKLTLEDMSGGGMTISNLGGIGGTYFTPIVNWPEVAILGVSRGVIEPVWRSGGSGVSGPLEGRFEARQMLPLSLSYDHRAIDGADAMRFLRWVVEAIEQPFLLSLIG
jgi:pyruvate dehydrogenase E2 component (dihydrolipoamide acetyltransferase)